MYSATKKTDGNYEVFKDGARITTGAKSILGNYGLSETQLTSGAATTGIGTSTPVSYTPTKTDLPGVGTLTVTPKAPFSYVDQSNQKDPLDNAAGLYERTGTNPPPTYTIQSGDTLSAIASRSGLSLNQILQLNPSIKDPNKIITGSTLNLGGGQTTQQTTPQSQPVASPVPGLPTYPTKQTETTQSSMLDAYNTLLKSITSIEDRIKSSSTPSEEEKKLAQDLAAKKAELAKFDVDLETRVNNLYGQGRGATKNSLAIRETQERRSSALEKLGLATEASTLATQLGLSQDERKAMGDLSSTEYNLATKRLDIALGIQKEIERMNDDDKSDARQYLLDVVNFAQGKTYDQLDSLTQNEIIKAVANSPITLDMVKTSLQSAFEKSQATARGELRSVAGVGVVQIMPNGTYKVVVPENPTPSPSIDIPTFADYISSQNLPITSLSDPNKLSSLKLEYDLKYGGQQPSEVNVGKLTTTNKNDLAQAGLSTAPATVQSYFLNSPTEFRDLYQRNFASGKGPKNVTLDELITQYTTWYNEQKKKTGTRDWSSIFGTATTTAK